MKRLTSALLFLIGAFATCAMPAAAQQAQGAQINVFVTNAQTREDLPFVSVYYSEPPSACNGGHTAPVTSQTDRAGHAEFGLLVCPGPAIITVAGGSQFDTQKQEIEIVPGQHGYNVFVKLEPKGRVVHIRVQGRRLIGDLVPVRAMIYDQSGQRIAITDDGGFATVRSKGAIGETVTLLAKAPHWPSTTASYIVGASEAGSRITRSDDYVNFVLNSEEAAKQEIALQITVKGKKGGAEAPIEHALIYDENGQYLTSTDSRGHAAALVEQPLGETFRLKAEAQHWTSQTLSLLGRSETRNAYAGSPGSKYLHQTVRFLLSPATNETGDLVVEVLDRDTDKPVPNEPVELYRPTSFPGSLIVDNVTNDKGEVIFTSLDLTRALSSDQVRIKAGGWYCYAPAIENVAASLTHGEAPRYVIYLRKSTC